MTRLLLSAIFLIASSSPLLASDTAKVTLVPTKIKVKKFGKIDSSRVIVLKGEVTQSKMDKLSAQLRKLSKDPKKPAYLEINSFGGSIPAGLSFIEVMKDLKQFRGLKTICVIRGAAYSMGAVIAMYCHETYMMQLSDMMFHGASYGVRGNAEEVSIRVKHMDRWIKNMEICLSAQMGLTLNEYLRMRGRELWLTAPDAAKHGFINGITQSFFHEALPPKEEKFRFFFGNIFKPVVTYLGGN